MATITFNFSDELLPSILEAVQKVLPTVVSIKQPEMFLQMLMSQEINDLDSYMEHVFAEGSHGIKDMFSTHDVKYLGIAVSDD